MRKAISTILATALLLGGLYVCWVWFTAPARADDAIAAWECDDARVELHRLAVHAFEFRIGVDTPHPGETWRSPLSFDNNGRAIGHFNLKLDKNGAILNGKRCRISCTNGRECE